MTAFHFTSAICNNNNAQNNKNRRGEKKKEKKEDFKWQLEINCDRIFLR